MIITEKKNYNKKIKKSSINFLLKKSDLIVICIPSTDKNFNFLNKERIDLIKKDAILVNTSRGEIIDEKYIIKLAKKKYLYYSADVVQNEQFIKKNYYLKMNKNNNLLITSHLAGLTNESIYKTDKEILKNFLSYYEKN